MGQTKSTMKIEKNIDPAENMLSENFRTEDKRIGNTPKAENVLSEENTKTEDKRIGGSQKAENILSDGNTKTEEKTIEQVLKEGEKQHVK